MRNFLKIILAGVCFLPVNTPVALAADPFEACPTQAFIVQSPLATPITFGVDLATGNYATLAADMGTTKVNGVGFNYHDSYLYGWDYGAATLAQIGNDFQAVALNVSNLTDKTFYVGDVSVDENAWYGYRSSYGLYRIDLSDPMAALSMELIATSTHMNNPLLTDMAFHPDDGFIYAVDNNGYLLTINPVNGETTVLTQVLDEEAAGFRFTFGAQFFDVSGNLYLSNNGNGYIYRVSINGAESSAIFFAYGPSSNSNDGARCALAAIEAGDAVDFGDAPDSYGSSFDNAGARHSISTLYLGNSIDADTDAYVFPLSDDLSDNNDDDDGINFPVGFEIGESAFVLASVSGSGGYLNAWIDFDLDGEFQNDEQIITGLAISEGTSNLPISIPSWALPGDSWARFRISSIASIGPTGGVSDGEVEDYPVTVVESGVATEAYPGASDFTSFAFEDLYPEMGDFDMNDVLVNVRITEYIKDGMVIRIRLEGKVAALGASYHNGFAFQLPGVDAALIKSDSITLTVNGVASTDTVLEANQTSAVLIVSQDLWQITQAGENGCIYFRTEHGCGTSQRPSWVMTVPLLAPIDTEDMPAMPYDPFIFATPSTFHGDAVTAVTGSNPGRKLEIHLKNKPPTDAFERQIFNLADDASNENLQLLFQTVDGAPWALEIPTDWKHPLAGVSIMQAYPQFLDFARDSSGLTNPLWYLEQNANQSSLFND